MSCPPDGRHGVVSEEEAKLRELQIFVLGPPRLAIKKRETANGPHGELVCRNKGLGKGVEGDAKLLKHAERHRDDSFVRREFDEFAAVAGEDLHTSTLPLDSFDRTGKLDASAGLASLAGKELGEAVIAFAYAEELVCVDFFFGLLLDSEGMDADLAIVGGIETLDVLDDLFAFLRRELIQGRVVCEGEIRAFPFFKAAQEFKDFTLLVALLQLAVSVAVADAVEAVCLESGFADQVPELRWVAVDELSSDFEDLVLIAQSAYTAADAIAGLENEDLATCLGEAAGCGEASHAGTDDQNALSSGIHLAIGCGEDREVIGYHIAA